MSDPAYEYSLLARVLRSCVVGTKTEEPISATTQLAAWVQESLASSGFHHTLSPTIILDKLRAAANDLFTEVQEVDMETATPTLAAGAACVSTYKQFEFIHDVLCEPPTTLPRLARTLDVDEDVINSWLSDEPGTPESQQVLRRILNLLVDLCSEPESPSDEVPPKPLRSFEDLLFLGDLRTVFQSLYGTTTPKNAQAAHIPDALLALRNSYTSNLPCRLTIVAPTNSGKNGIFLAAALAAIVRDLGPVLVLQPYRAQVSESAKSWLRSVARRPIRRSSGVVNGISVAGSSADMSTHDAAIRRGRIDLVSIIPEKLIVLSRQSHLVALCRLLIVDEIGLLCEPERGPKTEILLTLAMEAKLPIIAAGAGVPHPEAVNIAAWLAELTSGQDPIAAGALAYDDSLKRDPPIEYVVWRQDGKRRIWREGMAPLESIEDDSEPLPEDKELAVTQIIMSELDLDPSRQILVFLENREKIVSLADEIARTLRDDMPSLARRLDAEANDSTEVPLRELWLGGAVPYVDLPEILQQRVGVHTRDIPSNNIELIVSAFRSGRIRVLCATTTVEAGINLPVDTVIQVGLVDHARRRLGQRTIAQRLGRSGRTLSARDAKPGRGIIYVDEKSVRLERIIRERILHPDLPQGSQLTEPYRALLLLAYLGDEMLDATRDDLQRLLARSFWAFGRSVAEISSGVTAALNVLQRQDLVHVERIASEEGSPARDVLRATPTGKALASALLLPEDAEGIRRIVHKARQAPSDEQWLVEVLYAACQVPSIQQGDRRPREADVIRSGPQSLVDRVQAWTRQDSPGEWTFGFPKVRPRMVAGPTLAQFLAELSRSGAKPIQIRTLLRTYLAWLWSLGRPVEVTSALRGITDHVVGQDLAYFLSHVIRAAAWLAEYEKSYLVSLRLREVSKQVAFGVPIAAVHFYESCGEHFTRSAIADVPNHDYERLLMDLPPAVKDDLKRRLLARRGRRQKRNELDALYGGVVGKEGELANFTRVDTASGLLALFEPVWDSVSAGPLRVLDDSRLVVGSIVLAIAHHPDELEQFFDADLVLVIRPLPESLRVSREQMTVSVIGTAQLLVLLTQLNRLEGFHQRAVLEVLAQVKAVCREDFIQAVTAEVVARWAELSFRAGPDSPMPTPGQEVVSQVIAAARPFVHERPGIPTAATVAGAGAASEVQSLISEANEAAKRLLGLADENIAARARSLRDMRPDQGEETRAELERWKSIRLRLKNLGGDLRASSPRVAMMHGIEELNRLGNEIHGDTWDRIELRKKGG